MEKTNDKRGSTEVIPDEPRRRNSRQTLPHPLPNIPVTIGRSRLARTNSLEGKEAALQYFAAVAASTAAHGNTLSSSPHTTPSPTPSSPAPVSTGTTTLKDLLTSTPNKTDTSGSAVKDPQTSLANSGIISPMASAGSQLLRLLQSQSREERWAAIVQKIDSGIEHIEMKLLKREIRRGGVPAQYRGQIWLYTSGAKARIAHNQNVYKELVRIDPKLSPSAALIEKDLKRSLPEAINNDDVISALRRVLVAYSHYNPEVGYCQSMNFIAAILLLFMNEEEAFWLLSVIVEHFMTNYLSETMLGVLADARLFKELLAQRCPKLVAHFEKLSVQVDPLICKWFLSLFINCMPFECTIRFLDSYFLEGYKILLRVSLTLFRIAEKRFLACNDFEPAYLLLNILPSKAPAAHVLFTHAFDRLYVGSLPASRLNKMKELHLQSLYEEKKDLIERAQARCDSRRQEHEKLLASAGVVINFASSMASPSESTSPSTASSSGNASPRFSSSPASSAVTRGRSVDVISGGNGNAVVAPAGPAAAPVPWICMPPVPAVPGTTSSLPLSADGHQPPLSPRPSGASVSNATSPRTTRVLTTSGSSRFPCSPNRSPQRPSHEHHATLESQIDPTYRSRFRPLSFLVKGVAVSDDALDPLAGLSPRSSPSTPKQRDSIMIDQSS